MDLSNLHTTLRAHQKLSPSILENYVLEVEDRESDKIYARSGKERAWKELKTDTIAKPILIRFDYNLDE